MSVRGCWGRLREEGGGARDGGFLGLRGWSLGLGVRVRGWLVVMLGWAGLSLLGRRRHAGLGGICVIACGPASAARHEAERFDVEGPAWVAPARRYAGTRCRPGKCISGWPAGSGTACSTTGRPGRAAAAAVDELG